MPSQGEAYPLSQAQGQIWLAEQRFPGSATYIIESTCRVSGHLDIDALTDALGMLVRRHAVLGVDIRSNEFGVPRQYFAGRIPGIRRLRARGDTPADRARDALDLAAGLLAQPFDLDGNGLARATLIEIGPADHLVSIAYHHLLGDGLTSRVIRRDLLELYQKTSTGSQPTQAAAPDYRVHLDAERQPASRERRALDTDATVARIMGAPGRSTVEPGSRPPLPWPRAHWLELPVDADLSKSISAVARKARATPFIVFLTALHLLVQSRAEQSDTLAGFMYGNRVSHQSTAAGLYTQALVSRLQTTSDTTADEAVRRVRADAMQAVANAQASLGDVVRRAGEGTGGTGHPLFQTLLNFLPLEAPFALGDMYVTPVILPREGSWLDLELRIYARQDGFIQGYLRCPSEVFNRRMAECLAGEYLTVLRDAAHAAPGGTV